MAPPDCQTSTFAMSLEMPQCFIPIEATWWRLDSDT